MATDKLLAHAEGIEGSIFIIRRARVMLSSHLAALYDVEPRALVQAVKRNRDRFPADFMFQLTAAEWENLKSQTVTSSWGGSRRAVQVNIEIMRAFVRLREMLASNAQLARKLTALEKKYDEQFKAIFDAIRELMAPPEPKKTKIGFIAEEKTASHGRR